MNSTDNGPKWPRSWLLISLAVFLIIVAALAWAFKINDVISNLAALFGILGAVLAIFSKSSSPPQNSPTILTNAAIENQEQGNNIPKIEGVTGSTLGLTKGRGALVVYTNSSLLGSPIRLVFGFHGPNEKADIVEHIVRRKTNNHRVFVAVFPDLPSGRYTICSDVLGRQGQITVRAGDVKEVDWRERTHRQATPIMSQHSANTEKP